MEEKIQTASEFKHCPFCEKEATLTKSETTKTRIKTNKVVKGVFVVWKCSNCKEEFFHNWDIKTMTHNPKIASIIVELKALGYNEDQITNIFNDCESAAQSSVYSVFDMLNDRIVKRKNGVK